MVETIKVGNCLVEIIRPELNEEERKKRETEVREALGRFAFEIESRAARKVWFTTLAATTKSATSTS